MAKLTRFFIISILISFILLALLFPFSSSLSTEQPPNVILIGWDGVQRNHLFELLNQDELPNTRALSNEGSIANITITDHPTDTKAGWSQILTGYRSWKMGIYSNEYWFNSIPTGYTIFERVRNNFGDNIITAFITSYRREMEIQDGTFSAESGKYSQEAVFSNIPSVTDIVSFDFRNASVTGQIALDFLENCSGKNFFAFIHFGDPDYAGHVAEEGENSELYDDSIKTCDYWLGQIVNKLQHMGIYQKTFIYITSDHGFDENGRSHFYAPEIFLATNDNRVGRNGDQVDVAPTIYYRMGMWNLVDLHVDGFPLQLDLSYEEKQNRQEVLMDKTPPSTPIIMSPLENAVIDESSVISFKAFDEHLSSVLLLIDNKLQTGVSLEWNKNNVKEVTGTYEWNNIDVGYHNLTVLAFDEHGALNNPSYKSIIVEVDKNGNLGNKSNIIVFVAVTIVAIAVVAVIAYRKYRRKEKDGLKI